MNWWRSLKGQFKINEPLKAHTTFKIGGPARFFIEPEDIGDLKSLLCLLKARRVSFLVIGAGSNILASDKGINKAVIRLSSDCFKRFSVNGRYLEAGSSLMLDEIVRRACAYGLSGAEFLAGIPGTVGGALVMNAGVSEKNNPYAKSIGNLIERVTVMDRNCNINTLYKEEIKFEYRSSSLSNYIILSACFKLRKKNETEIKNRINRYLDFRRDRLDLAYPSAGCIFKNPDTDSAGRLIDLCGLKGAMIGGALISSKHANFILNLNSAKADDVCKLIGLIRKKVKSKFNVILEPEVKIWK